MKKSKKQMALRDRLTLISKPQYLILAKAERRSIERIAIWLVVQHGFNVYYANALARWLVSQVLETLRNNISTGDPDIDLETLDVINVIVYECHRLAKEIEKTCSLEQKASLIFDD